MKTTKHSLLSSYREALIEHLFVGEVLRELWKRGPVEAEIMKPQVDDAGYDVVIEAKGVTRHIQLKSSFTEARTARQKVHLKLERKPSGCVVWVMFDQKNARLQVPFVAFFICRFPSDGVSDGSDPSSRLTATAW